jgi:hypothetical protein
MTRTNPHFRPKILLCGIAVLLFTLAPRLAPAQTRGPDVSTLCRPLDKLRRPTEPPSEKPCLTELKNVAERRNRQELTLKLGNGKTTVLSHSAECDSRTEHDACVTRELVGRIGDRQFIIHVWPVMDCDSVLLVSRRTGAETELEDWPHLSPDGNRFAVVAASGQCGSQNTVAIYALDSDPPRLEWRYNPAGDEDYDFNAWDGNNRVRLVVTVNDKRAATGLTLTAEGWRLRRANGEISPGVSGAPPVR